MFDVEAMAKRSVEQAEMRLRREMRQRCDWQNAEDVALYRRDRARGKRRVQLDVLVPQRRCPVCREIRIGPRQWVVNKVQTSICCLSCYRKFEGLRNNEPVEICLEGVFTPVRRYELAEGGLRKIRKSLNVRMGTFSSLCGWSAAYQLKLETKTRTIDEKTMKILLRNFLGFRAQIVGNNPLGKDLMSEIEAMMIAGGKGSPGEGPASSDECEVSDGSSDEQNSE